MNDYVGVLGHACVSAAFRNDLLEHGAAAVEMHHLPADLTVDDRIHLDEFKTADNKAALTASWTAAGSQINAACGKPPCPYFGGV